MSNGKIRIVGKAIEASSGPRRRLSWKEQIVETNGLDRYFEQVVFEDTEPQGRISFRSRTIYIGRDGIFNAPRMRTPEEVNINSGFGRYARLSSVTLHVPEPWEARSGEAVIIFRFDGKRRNRGIYYKDSKTLVLCNLQSSRYGNDYIRQIIDYLVTANSLSVLPPRPQVVTPPAPGTFKRGIEFHDGQRVWVNLPLPRKTVTVGCDPEFEYVSEGAATHAPSCFRGVGPNIEIGVDGAGSQVEIRPKPSHLPAEVVSNMVTIMKRLATSYHGVHLSTRGNRYPLGGHIHVGVGRPWNPDGDLVFMLDYFLGKVSIDLSGTARQGYKRMSQYREQDWGFEYRTPPAALFAWPEFARLSLKICKVTTECYINGQTIILNPEPTFEDYWNYCGFTPREYERWRMYLDRYRDFMGNANGYQQNVVTNWTSDETIACFPPRTAEQAQQMAAEVAPVVDDEDEEEEVEVRNPETQAETISRLMSQAIQREQAAGRHRTLQFSDDWSESIRETFRSSIMTAEFPPDRYPSIFVHIFGLGENRGNVTYGYTVEGSSRIPCPPGSLWIGYGVPRRVRMGECDYVEIARHIVGIANELRTIVQPVSQTVTVENPTPTVSQTEPVAEVAPETVPVVEEAAPGGAIVRTVTNAIIDPPVAMQEGDVVEVNDTASENGEAEQVVDSSPVPGMLPGDQVALIEAIVRVAPLPGPLGPSVDPEPIVAALVGHLQNSIGPIAEAGVGAAIIQVAQEAAAYYANTLRLNREYSNSLIVRSSIARNAIAQFMAGVGNLDLDFLVPRPAFSDVVQETPGVLSDSVSRYNEARNVASRFIHEVTLRNPEGATHVNPDLIADAIDRNNRNDG